MKKIVLLTEVSEDAFTVDLTKISQCQINSLMAAAHKGINGILFPARSGSALSGMEAEDRSEGKGGREQGMREKLQAARKSKGLTQQAVADYLGISERYYRYIESGTRDGDFEIWDDLEDLFSIHQRILRRVSANESVK